MIRLKINATPEWVEIGPGVRMLLRPMTTAIYYAALSAPDVQAAHAEADEFAVGAAISKAVVARAVIEWQGVGDLDGAPIEPTPEAVSALLDHAVYAEGFDRLYLYPWLTVGDEKKDSSPVPDGTLAAGPSIAKTAPPAAPAAPIDSTNR